MLNILLLLLEWLIAYNKLGLEGKSMIYILLNIKQERLIRCKDMLLLVIDNNCTEFCEQVSDTFNI